MWQNLKALVTHHTISIPNESTQQSPILFLKSLSIGHDYCLIRGGLCPTFSFIPHGVLNSLSEGKLRSSSALYEGCCSWKPGIQSLLCHGFHERQKFLHTPSETENFIQSKKTRSRSAYISQLRTKWNRGFDIIVLLKFDFSNVIIGIQIMSPGHHSFINFFMISWGL